MPKSPEKFFEFKKESQPEKSEEEQKEEKALAIIEEFKVLREKAKTKEDWELLTEKLKEIKKIFTPEKERKLPSLEVFRETIKEIEEKTKKKVTALDKWQNYEEIEGKLNGSVRVKRKWRHVIVGKLKVEGKWLPVIAGKLIEEIDGKKIENCDNIQNIGDKLNGSVKVEGKWLPVIAGKLIEEIDGKKIENCDNIQNIGDKLNGIVGIEGKGLPVVLGKIVK